METSVNQRVLLLKKELDLSNSEFCLKAKISTGTLYTIQNGVQMKSKTINSLCEAFNINKEWLLHGKGNMFAEIKEIATTEKSNVSKALELLEQQLAKKDEQIAQLMAIFSKVNFLNAIGDAQFTKYLPGKLTNSVRAVA